MAVDRRALLGHVARRGPWRAMAGIGAAVGVVVVWRAATIEGVDGLVPWLRLAGVLLASVVASSVEDVGQPISNATPVGRFRRRLLGVALPASASIVVWLVVVAVAVAFVNAEPGERSLPIVGLALEPLALASVGLLLGALAARTGERGSGTRASVATVVVVMLTFGHPRSIEWLWAPPGNEPAWSDGRVHWAVVGVVAAILFVSLSLDPARRLTVGRSGRTR